LGPVDDPAQDHGNARRSGLDRRARRRCAELLADNLSVHRFLPVGGKMGRVCGEPKGLLKA
jgi:hypothetical protein